jgi:hypothetical protein
MDAMTRQYEALTLHERFVLTIEAMARGDEVECNRLEDTCPRFTYRAEDAEFRDRMRRAYGIASRVCLNMRAGLARIRMAQAFQDTASHFAGPLSKFATAAYLCGRACGRTDGGLPSAGPEDASRVAKEVASDAGLQEQLAEIREVAAEVVGDVADTLHHTVGEADAVDLLSQWEGFVRFCQDNLGIVPLVLLRALALEQSDPAAEVRAAHPSAKATETEIRRWLAQWTRGWERRFK